MINSAPSTPEANSNARWVSIRRACELLGVNQATLRHWTDAGKVRAYLTPGGHRRYMEDDLRQLRETSAPSSTDLTAALMASRERYDQIERRGHPDHEWMQALGPPGRQRFRILGASMIHQLTGFVLANTKRERERSLDGGRGVAMEYGQEAARLGLSLHDAMQAFLFYRFPIVESVTRWFGDQSQRGPRVADTLLRMNQFMDEVLLTMTRAHEEARQGAQTE